jgi:hypothetical protein
MKPLKLFVVLFTFYFVACANKQAKENNETNTVADTSVAVTLQQKDSFATGQIINNIICKTDASQSFALYIPSKYKTDSLPVIYFFDPHADGELPLKNYKALADKYGFILIGSNNSKNGNDWQTTENIWNNLFNDTKSRLTFNQNRIYTCGFSGGAKVAGYVALHHNEIKSVIANSAGLPDDVAAGNFNFSFTGLAGKGDMNMTDVIALNNELDKTQTRHRIILFDGKHEWAPASAMDIVFAGLQLDAMYNKRIPKNDAFVHAFIESSKQRLNSDLKTHHYLQADEECKLSINMLSGLTGEVNFFKTQDASVTNNSAYKQQLQTEQNLFTIEQNKKAEYQQQFQQGDMNYWASTIGDLQKKSNPATAEGQMYQRLLAYLSLAFYSISNQLINNNQNDAAQYFVTLYKMVDATNSEAWYFSAILNARNNNTKAAEDDLIKATGYGFNDVNRMMQQPEFQKLSTQINFSAVESNMKK